ncbi:MAG: TIGR03960 family B12-binding radical SAM protein [Desulfobacteraceae bacterium]|nr:TIGR03960 family B12-binding radical SAM protein [Desulfobacteraceae bacterium]
MAETTIQDILPLVEKPSRYLGTEVNRERKDPRRVKLRFALAFPDLYEIGTSHFGIQILYRILNDDPEIAAERVFSPAVDMAEQLRSHLLPLTSLETGTPLKEFDILGFSLLYELNYTNVLEILDLSGIPFAAKHRTGEHPLVVAGGPCTVNPEPVADFFDAIVVGDGETVVLKMARSWMKWRERGSEDRRRLLHRWARIEGVYVPSLYSATFDPSGFQQVHPKQQAPWPIRKALVSDLNRSRFPEAPVVPFGRPVHDRLRIEISRGCSRGCRFCQAGMIYRPVRERNPESLIRISEASVSATGYQDLSLLSLSTGDYGPLASLIEQLMRRHACHRVAVSLPSIRAGTLTPELMKWIRSVRKTGFTIAPEAGSQRLRDVINKNITDADILDTVGSAFELGWRVIKLYFMIGLPTETPDDLQAIVDLVQRLKGLRPRRGAMGNINVSVATFIPKPHTPFQWAPQVSVKEATEKLHWLKGHLGGPGIHFKWQNPHVSHLEGAWSRGDRRLGRWLEAAYRRGCRFDGWSDHFRYDRWLDAAAEQGIDMSFYTERERRTDEPLPWDGIDVGVTKSFLVKEWHAALHGEITPDCRTEGCSGCGICDFETITPVLASDEAFEREPDIPQGSETEDSENTLEIRFRKTGPARFFGHLEMANVFLRALQRAGVPVAFTRGYHPKPRIAFRDPLPIGLESLEETFFLAVTQTLDPKCVLHDLNRQLPEGLEVFGCSPAPPRSLRHGDSSITYRVALHTGIVDTDAIRRFQEQNQWPFQRRPRKGKPRSVDLRQLVEALVPIDERSFRITIRKQDGVTIRPAEVLRSVFQLEEVDVRKARITKETESGIRP